MQNAIINVKGQILNPDQAKISVFDRGYLYGDSLYEVVRSYHGEFYLLDEHLGRLKASANLCHMTLDQNISTYKSEILRTFQVFKSRPENRKLEAYARIIISRGVGKIGFGLDCLETPPLYTIIIQPVEPPTQAQYKKGMRVQITRRIRNDRRALDPAMKSGNYLNSVLAYLEANAAGYTDALLTNSEGHITEGTTFNVFYVKRGILATPPLDVGILEGVTRRKVMELSRILQIPCREVRFPKERLFDADEVFLSSSIKEVFPITQIDSVKIGTGAPGPITERLHQAYRDSLPQRTHK